VSATRSCPDWPEFLEQAPDLHFKHYTVAEAELPGEVLTSLPELPRDEPILCADLDHNVFNPAHTDERLGKALKDTYWYDVDDWNAQRRS
jgi:hypothetical protein